MVADCHGTVVGDGRIAVTPSSEYMVDHVGSLQGGGAPSGPPLALGSVHRKLAPFASGVVPPIGRRGIRWSKAGVVRAARVAFPGKVGGNAVDKRRGPKANRCGRETWRLL